MNPEAPLNSPVVGNLRAPGRPRVGRAWSITVPSSAAVPYDHHGLVSTEDFLFEGRILWVLSTVLKAIRVIRFRETFGSKRWKPRLFDKFHFKINEWVIHSVLVFWLIKVLMSHVDITFKKIFNALAVVSIWVPTTFSLPPQNQVIDLKICRLITGEFCYVRI